MDNLNLVLNISSPKDQNNSKNRDESALKSTSNQTKVKKRKHGLHDAEVTKKQRSNWGQGKQVYSTLFNANPERPSISVPIVSENKETIFSSKSFKTLDLHPYMVSNLEKEMGFSQMTTVQERSIPVILKMKDALIKSQTGSGKTLAYGVPIVQMLQSVLPKVQRSDGVYALVLVPTRELALQSFETLKKLVKPFQWIVPGYIIGGEKKKSEKARLRKGINILVATPGRIVDHLETTACLGLDNIRWLVLDEADRLLDMGFEREVTKILNAVNSVERLRQNILLSATLSHNVERLADIALNEPASIDITEKSEVHKESIETDEYQLDESIEIEDGEDSYTLPQELQQYYIVVPSKLRLVTLAALVLQKAQNEGKMLIFLSSRDSVEFHFILFQNCLKSRDVENVKIFRLHGSMDQSERKHVYHEFHSSRSGVLLCTDVAARGLDLPEVNYIVQYNTPGTPAEYVHRAGRTARVGNRGQAILFLAPSEVEYINILSKKKIRLNEMDHNKILKYLMSLSKTDLLQSHHFSQLSCRTMEEAATRLQRRFEDFAHGDQANKDLAKQAFLSAIRAYTTYPSWLKHIFHIKKIHLGHMAKSFGLREAPANIKSRRGVGQKSSKRSKHQSGSNKFEHRPHQAKKNNVSEFDSGLESGSLVTKKVKNKINKKKVKTKSDGK